MKKLFRKPKEMTNEESREYLQKAGIRVNNPHESRPSKFEAFGKYARETSKANAQIYQPATGPTHSTNPYAANEHNLSYGGNAPPAKSSNPYASASGGSNPYASGGQSHSSARSDAGPDSGSGSGSNPYASSSARTNPYASVNSANANSYGSSGYSRARQNPYADAANDEEVGALKSELFKGAKTNASSSTSSNPPPSYHSQNHFTTEDSDDDELAQPDFTQEQEVEEVDSEEEGVQALKFETKAVRNETIESTRRALQLAEEAEASGRNVTGILGNDAEVLARTEESLEVSANLQRVAEEKARELKYLNGSIFKPHISNPLRSKARALEKERQIKTRYELEKMEREERRKVNWDSQQRAMNTLKDREPSELRQKYSKPDRKNNKYLGEDFDSEDEAQEDEIDHNLNELSHVANRLKNMATNIGDEIDSQNVRIQNISLKADKVDTHTVMNTHRLNNI